MVAGWWTLECNVGNNYKRGLVMSRDPKDLTQFLQEVLTSLKEWYKTKYIGRELFTTCTYRSPQEQAEDYAKGRTMPGNKITNCDGIIHPSKHNVSPARAFDFAIKEQGKVVWDDKYYLPVGDFVHNSKYKDKIRWGGDFKSVPDKDHIEEV